MREKLHTHKGKFLTAEAVKEYQQRALKLHGTNSQMTGERRKLCEQLMDEYSVTELEAINIVNGRDSSDYIAKYERIRTQTSLRIKKDTNVSSESES